MKPARSDFLLLKVFDQKLWLYQYREWNPAPFEINGAGPVEVKQFGDEDIVLQAQPGAHGLLRLNVTHYPKWHATRDGLPVPITLVSLPGLEHSAFMQVELSPGLYHFHFRRDMTDYAGTILCLLGTAGCVALARWDKILERKILPL
jgi:hypothetical protein